MAENKELQETKKPVYKPIFIPKKFVTEVRNKQGAMFFIVSFVHKKEAKEVYLPYTWIRKDKYGKGYMGRIKMDMNLKGNKKVPAEVNSNEFIPFFPSQKIKRKGE